MQPLYTTASKDLGDAMWAVRHDPKASFLTLAANRQLANAGGEYGRALQRQCDRRAGRMFSQFSTEQAPRPVQCPIVLLFVLELGGWRIVLDMRRIPKGIQALLPANWPKAEPMQFVPFIKTVIDPAFAPHFERLGVLEAM